MSAPVPISDNGLNPRGAGGGNSTTSGGAVIWPRRTTKACASCRRDKIRCDGGRPCGACAKKGYAAAQCTDGCEPCRRARVRCEDGNSKPCRRCLDMKIDCVDGPTISMYQGREPFQGKKGGSVGEDTVNAGGATAGASVQLVQSRIKVDLNSVAGTIQGSSTTSPPSSPTRSVGGRGPRSGERAKLACVSCRRDNKKCDDNRPCSRCIARSEQCIHVNRGPKLVKLRCEGCREENKRCEETRPCKYCVDNQKECVVVPRKGRGHGTRVKAACMSCRRDKIRCNGDRPCAACIKKGCDCVDRACTTCSRDGRSTDCAHRRTASLEMPAQSQTLVPASPPKEVSKPNIQREKDFRFVPSQEDSRWLSYAANNTQTESLTAVVQQPVHQPPTSLIPTGFYYPAYPNPVSHFSSPYSIGPPGGYPQPLPNPAAFFFDVLDPSLGNFQLSQHMSSTSSSRTFLPDD
ncbi:hypothetical protein CPB83DRAFT_882275 [Crepidotus variabilis]|uniref:Transcription activator of gluconeogenesis ERT1 n=1 Tax=Crepidotus variabilis TaxID=179855 RepID=A0A9P6EK97_9AGAR|nr:hypothetical protein CPB83DRAFT_882275 [Crepidotus variabilis]